MKTQYSPISRRLKRFARRYTTSQRGAALLEFALTMPVLLVMLLGGIEVTRMMLFHQKMDNATSAIGDVITRLDYEAVPCGGGSGLRNMRQNMLVEMMRPYDFEDNDGAMIVSAVEASYRDPNNADDDTPTRQRVLWQWNPDSETSRIGMPNADATGSAWPAVFARSPNNGGMFDGDRVIIVETFYTYETIVPGVGTLLNIPQVMDVYKNAFYRARFGNMNELHSDCP